jgi:hypothetical protein
MYHPGMVKVVLAVMAFPTVERSLMIARSVVETILRALAVMECYTAQRNGIAATFAMELMPV